MKQILKYSVFSLLFTCSFLKTKETTAQNLDEYLQIAAEENLGLKASYAEFEAAMQRAPQVRSLPDPMLTMSALGTKMQTKMGSEEAKFSLMQMFPWFGTLKARENMAVATAEAKFQRYLDARSLLFFEVKKQYYILYQLHQELKFQQENFLILENDKNLALSKVSAGAAALTDVLSIDLLMNESKTEIENLKLLEKSALTAFNLLLNRDKNLKVEIPSTLEIDFSELKNWESINLAEHPKILANQKMIDAAHSQEILAQKNGLPNIGIGVEYMVMGKIPDAHGNMNGKDAIMPMVSVSLPIFRKKHKAAKAEAEFLQESYQFQQEEIENILEAEFEDAIFQIEKAKNQVELYQKQINSTQQISDLLLTYYQNDTADFEQILNIRQELLKYQLAISKAKTAYFTAVARLNYITGKSF